MKEIIGLLVFAMMLFNGCTQAEVPKNISYIKLGDVTSCVTNLPPAFQELERKEESFVIYPKDLIYKISDIKKCEWIFKSNENKVVIGQIIEVGGCNSFSGEIEIKKDDLNKKVIVNFIKNTAPPDAMCTLDLRWINVWVAVDYIDNYEYESQIKSVIKN